MKTQYLIADKRDADEMIVLLQQLKSDHHEISLTYIENTDTLIREMECRRQSFYIARVNQQIAGILRSFRGIGPTEHSSRITIAVSSQHRKQGIAKNLLQFGMADLKTRGITIVRGLVYSDNRASLNVLISAGFTISGSIVKHHLNQATNQFVDDIVLYREL